MELQLIQSKIYEIRGYKVMLDFDLAEIYQVETKNLNLSVKRNIKRFPSDFMFQLTNIEWDSLRLQIETSKRGGRRYLPYAFTEQGVAMLSGILNSNIAIEMNISIMRAFVALRQYALGYAELKAQLDNFMLETNMQFNEIYQALTELAEQKKLGDKPRKPVGYVTNE
ncbi:MAG: ORF6N domain-containing protein [Prevotella sp.]|jgi:hypothetical protein|nr:ORF6N domain-containing protein [Prevotella sp.]